AGQFCTKPGMVFLPEGSDSASFSQKLQSLVSASTVHPLLTKGIRASYDSAVAARKTELKVSAESSQAGSVPQVALFETDAASFLASDLDDEIFGPTTLLVTHSNREHVLAIAKALHGHLTATIHGTEQDLRDFADLIAILENKVGRIVFNAF